MPFLGQTLCRGPTNKALLYVAMDPRNIVRFSSKPELLVDSAVDEEVQGRIDSKQKVAHLDLGLWVIRTSVS